MAKNRYDVDEEIKEKGSIKSFGMLFKYLIPQKKILIISGVLLAVDAFLSLINPYFIKIAIDDCIPNGDYKGIFILALLLLLASFGIWIVAKKRVYIKNNMAMEIIKKIRSDLYAHMQYLPFSFFDSRPHGKILVRVVNYVNTLTNVLANGLLNVIFDLFRMGIILVFMLSMNVQFTLICLAGVPVFVVALVFLRKMHKKAWDEYSQKQSSLNAYLQESLAGMKITQSFAREEINAGIFENLCEENKKKWMKAKYIATGIPRVVNILSITVSLIIYMLGYFQMKQGLIEIGLVIAFVSYVSNFWNPIIQLTDIYNEIVNCGVYLERIFDMIKEPLVIEDCEDASDMGEIEGNVTFENVSFKYEEDSPFILEKLNLDVKKGETIAIVGPTGAGKSTIINLLSRFYDINEGRLLIDGKDISKVTLNSLRRNMGIMLQDSFLFSGTIMDNIRYGKLDATDEEVIKAAKTVCAHRFISELPDGYNTVIKEGGSGLSIGQKQLIAFARTLICNPKILILDEATSSIDTETEIELQKGLESLLKGRTSFIIAHRLSTIKNSSRILYIADKNIKEQGTHEELLKLKGKYYSLYMAQYKFLEEI
ncbi:MAG: ABC transporter ATP-binding protein [Ruminococcaceae bacterium]|nr:ABC transporter ATP-binding protein [Oscillospiraceae bacterium]